MARFAMRLTLIGSALYVFLFIAAGAMHHAIGGEMYERLHIAEAWTPMLVIAGALLLPGAILAEIVFQCRTATPHQHGAGNGEKHGG